MTPELAAVEAGEQGAGEDEALVGGLGLSRGSRFVVG